MSKKSIDKRSKRWCFTINNPTEEELDKLSGYECEFVIYGLEHVGDTLATPHAQGYIEFKNQKRFGTLKKDFPRAHWEKAKGSSEQNIAYCSKEDKFPFKKGTPTKAKRVNPRRILRDDPVNGLRRLNVENTLHGMRLERDMLGEIMVDALRKPQVTYIYGASGSGKTYTALKMATEEYGLEDVATIRFDKNGFAHCNNPHAPCLVWMEFRPSCLPAVDFLELTDGYGCHLNVKHGGMFIRPRSIYICSILAPSQIYRDEINEQFIRRITTFVNKDDNPYQNYVDDADLYTNFDFDAAREDIYRI